MHVPRYLFALLLLTTATVEASAADLTRIDRALKKEPTYHSGRPKYALLVFGPEAKTRIWMVQDGNILYVDRNGNGDLTEDGEKVAAEKRDGDDEGVFSFKIGDVHDGPLVHRNLHLHITKIDHLASLDESAKAFLAKHPKGRGYLMFAEIEMPGWKGASPGGRVQQRTSYFDTKGFLQFADKPGEAPILHFGGPWQITLFGAQKLMAGRERDFVLGVGTPGVGPGTTTYIDYEGVIPDKVYPTVEITYPAKSPGEPPLREHYELKRRC
jgi:hypothetical protein